MGVGGVALAVLGVVQDGKTAVTPSVLYNSRGIRDAVLNSRMDQGVAAGYDRLEKLLGAMPDQGMEKGERAS